MRCAETDVTVSAVARNQLAGDKPRGHPPVALSERQWLGARDRTQLVILAYESGIVTAA